MFPIKPGSMFFVKDAFFSWANDPHLKQNKLAAKRPHYYAFEDSSTGLIWAIPCSSQIEKYERIIESKAASGRRSNHIQIIRVAGRREAFLFQDMFPLTPDFIESIYQNRYGPIEVRDPKKISEIERNARAILRLIRHNIKFTSTQPDALAIEQKLLNGDLEK